MQQLFTFDVRASVGVTTPAGGFEVLQLGLNVRAHSQAHVRERVRTEMGPAAVVTTVRELGGTTSASRSVVES
jgi:hypothetical protein